MFSGQLTTPDRFSYHTGRCPSHSAYMQQLKTVAQCYVLSVEGLLQGKAWSYISQGSYYVGLTIFSIQGFGPIPFHYGLYWLAWEEINRPNYHLSLSAIKETNQWHWGNQPNRPCQQQ